MPFVDTVSVYTISITISRSCGNCWCI